MKELTELQITKKLDAVDQGKVVAIGGSLLARQTKDGVIVYGFKCNVHGRRQVRFIQGKSRNKVRTELLDTRDMARRNHDGLGAARKAAPKLTDWLDVYMALLGKQDKLRVKDNRIDYAVLLKKSMGHIPINAITTPNVMDYREWRLSKVSDSTINKELTLLSMAMKYGKKKGHVTNNPVQDTREAEGESDWHIITQEEEAALLAVAPAHIKPIITVALETGLRAGELVGLTWDKVQWTEGRILINRSLDGPTKTRRARYVPLTNAVRETLHAIGRQPGGRVFQYEGRDFGRFNGAWRRMRRDASKRLGYKLRARIHDMRHTACTRMIAAEPNIIRVQMIMGHTNVTTTQLYIHLAEDFKQVVAKMDQRRIKIAK